MDIMIEQQFSASLFKSLTHQGRNLLVFGAASLKDALDHDNAQYQHDSGRKTLAFYGASSALAKEIENGAPADIFWSSDLHCVEVVSIS